jgi:hypothetical protein
MWRVACAGVVVAAVVVPLHLEGQVSPNRDVSRGREVTFASDVAPIVYTQCVFCHRPGEVAPFSLLTYKDARPWARSIKQKVIGRQMPPWKADPHYGDFQNSRVLTDRDIETIAAWVDGGAKEGNPADMPSPPQFAEGWQIGVPDLVLTMAEPLKIPATGAVPWVTVPSNDYVFPNDTWVQAIEVRPGNRAVVHHAVAAAIFPGNRSDVGGSNLHLYSPGLEAIIWRDGYGKLIPKGTRISFQMHYNSIGRETTDQTKVGFRFATKPVHTPVNTTIISNTAILIPPMVQNHEAIAAFQFPVDARVHGLRPHMHLRAREGTASLIYPDGLRRVLLHIPRWDDAWQNYYVLREPARVPQGTILEYVASYDNSPANALNPDPKSSVAWGQQIWEEMHSTYMTWTAITDKNVNDTEPIQIPASAAFTIGVSARR